MVRWRGDVEHADPVVSPNAQAGDDRLAADFTQIEGDLWPAGHLRPDHCREEILGRAESDSGDVAVQRCLDRIQPANRQRASKGGDTTVRLVQRTVEAHQRDIIRTDEAAVGGQLGEGGVAGGNRRQCGRPVAATRSSRRVGSSTSVASPSDGAIQTPFSGGAGTPLTAATAELVASDHPCGRWSPNHVHVPSRACEVAAALSVTWTTLGPGFMRSVRRPGGQSVVPTAFCRIFSMVVATAADMRVTAYSVGQMSPSSSRATSLNPNVA